MKNSNILFNASDSYGLVAKLLHWTTAAAFVGAYIFVYYVIWFMDDTKPESLPVLNIHWALGVLVGALVLPRIIWKCINVHPVDISHKEWENRLAHFAHALLYGLLFVMPLSGYLGTGAPTNLGLFSIEGFNDTSLFTLISKTFSISWKEFEQPIDVVHHFLGKWVGWSVVAFHIAAAFYHHLVRRDDVLIRMLPKHQRKS